MPISTTAASTSDAGGARPAGRRPSASRPARLSRPVSGSCVASCRAVACRAAFTSAECSSAATAPSMACSRSFSATSRRKQSRSTPSARRPSPIGRSTGSAPTAPGRRPAARRSQTPCSSPRTSRPPASSISTQSAENSRAAAATERLSTTPSSRSDSARVASIRPCQDSRSSRPRSLPSYACRRQISSAGAMMSSPRIEPDQQQQGGGRGQVAHRGRHGRAQPGPVDGDDGPALRQTQHGGGGHVGPDPVGERRHHDGGEVTRGGRLERRGAERDGDGDGEGRAHRRAGGVEQRLDRLPALPHERRGRAEGHRRDHPGQRQQRQRHRQRGVRPEEVHPLVADPGAQPRHGGGKEQPDAQRRLPPRRPGLVCQQQERRHHADRGEQAQGGDEHDHRSGHARPGGRPQLVSHVGPRLLAGIRS